MPANVYECMFLLDTTKIAGDLTGAVEQLHAILQRNHAEILASRPWAEQRLAFPVKGQKKGQYYLIYFKTEGKNVINIEHDCALNESILRMLILHIDAKLVDLMLAVANDEHAMALQTVNEPPPGEDGDIPGIDMGGDDGGRPIRRSRRPLEVAD
jgi:small subunit ribosomal protein S6